MALLQISLFGKFSVRYHNHELIEHLGRKVQELIAYLSLHRDRMLSRENLASLLWNGECTTAQSRKYLRKTLWKMQRCFPEEEALLDRLLHIEHEWIQFNTIDELELDVYTFEQAFSDVQGRLGEALDARQVASIEEAVSMYQDGLLLNMYVDWCLEERERFKWLYLALLDKLTQYYRHIGNYDKAICLTRDVLHIDEVRECSHRMLMELYHRAGDRTSALRQFSICEQKLRDEFDTKPSRNTVALYRHIEQEASLHDLPASGASEKSETSDVTYRRTMQSDMASLHRQLKDMIQQVETMMRYCNSVETGIFSKKKSHPVKKNGAETLMDTG